MSMYYKEGFNYATEHSQETNNYHYQQQCSGNGLNLRLLSEEETESIMKDGIHEIAVDYRVNSNQIVGSAVGGQAGYCVSTLLVRMYQGKIDLSPMVRHLTNQSKLEQNPSLAQRPFSYKKENTKDDDVSGSKQKFASAIPCDVTWVPFDAKGSLDYEEAYVYQGTHPEKYVDSSKKGDSERVTLSFLKGEVSGRSSALAEDEELKEFTKSMEQKLHSLGAYNGLYEVFIWGLASSVNSYSVEGVEKVFVDYSTFNFGVREYREGLRSGLGSVSGYKQRSSVKALRARVREGQAEAEAKAAAESFAKSSTTENHLAAKAKAEAEKAEAEKAKAKIEAEKAEAEAEEAEAEKAKAKAKAKAEAEKAKAKAEAEKAAAETEAEVEAAAETEAEVEAEVEATPVSSNPAKGFGENQEVNDNLRKAGDEFTPEEHNAIVAHHDAKMRRALRKGKYAQVRTLLEEKGATPTPTSSVSTSEGSDLNLPEISEEEMNEVQSASSVIKSNTAQETPSVSTEGSDLNLPELPPEALDEVQDADGLFRSNE